MLTTHILQPQMRHTLRLLQATSFIPALAMHKIPAGTSRAMSNIVKEKCSLPEGWSIVQDPNEGEVIHTKEGPYYHGRVMRAIATEHFESEEARNQQREYFEESKLVLAAYKYM